MIAYRSLHPAEEQQALDLWAATIAAPREVIARPYWSDPQRIAHTRVAVTDAGVIIAAAHYCLRQVLIGSGFVTPLAGVDPHTLSDEALAAATALYRLIRIRRTEARTGPDGPGDLAWVWPLSTLGALLLLARRSRRPRRACAQAHQR